MPGKMGISAKFILFIALALAVFFIAFFYVSFNIMRNYAFDNAEAMATTILEETDKRINYFFDEKQALAVGLAAYSAVYTVDVERMKELFIAMVLARKEYLRAIYLGTEDGRMFEWGYGKGFVDYTPTLPEDYDPRKRPWYRAALEAGGYTISEPYLYASVEALGITCVLPVYDPERELVGVLGLDILLEDLKSILESLEIPLGGRAILLNERGEIITSQIDFVDPQGKESREFDSVTIDWVLRQRSGSFDGYAEGEKTHFAFQKNDIIGWTLVIAMPYASIMEPVSKIFTLIMFLDLVLVLLLIVALGFITNWIILKPLNEIIMVINKIEAGDKTLRVSVKSKDEFAQLGEEFNTLVNTVAEYSSSLEDKVKRRTEQIAELQQENMRLRIIEERKRIYRDMHDSLGAKLTNISICNNVARSSFPRDPDKMIEMFDRIDSNCRLGISNLKEIIWGMREDEKILQDFTKFLVVNSRRSLKPKNVSFEYRIFNREFINELPVTIRLEMVKIMDELVNNVLKHSQATKVKVVMKIKKNLLLFIFSDNGIGFNARKDESEGSGLGNIEYRIRKIGGIKEIYSAPGRGTRYTLRIPVKEN